MIDLPNSATFAAALAEPRLYAAMAVAALAGVTRGFSGFGGAMVYMPLIAAIYDPRIAAVTILLVDFVSATPFAIPEVRRCTWREVGPLSVAMAAGLPIGVWLLIVLDPIVLRWFIAVMVLSLVPVLASGWRYHGAPRLPMTIGVGLFSGVTAGAVLIAGPPVILYWLGGGNSAKIVRANLMVFFMICDIILVAIFGFASRSRPVRWRYRCSSAYPTSPAWGLDRITSTAPRIGSTATSPTSSSRWRQWSACRSSIRS